MADERDMITVYYYTAWDGFSWQGCDESEAKSLQRYMEATGTLPETSADKPPFGGAVPCKIGGKVGVAVYRYHTREKGDMSGRDCLYIALAFVPLKVGCVDFGKILTDTKLSATQPGALDKEYLSAGKFRIALDGDGRTTDHWMDRKLDDEFLELSGREGLRTLSRLYFSEHAQLGFLNAVFTSDSGVDGIVSTQTYHVYREVASVVAASERLQNSSLHSDEERALVEMNSAVDALGVWAIKAGYSGLREYYDLKREEARSFGAKQHRSAIADYTCELEKLYRHVENTNSMSGTAANGMDAGQKRSCEECIDKAKSVVQLPVANDQEYRSAVKLAIDAACSSSYVSGYIEGARKCRDELQGEINKLRSELAVVQDRKAWNCDGIRPGATDSRTQNMASPPANGGAVAIPSGPAERKSYWWILEWALTGLIAAAIAAAAVAIIYMLVAGRTTRRATGERADRWLSEPSTNVVEADAQDVTLETPVMIATNSPNSALEEAGLDSPPALVEQVSSSENAKETEGGQEHARHNTGALAVTQKSDSGKIGKSATEKSASKTTENSTHPASVSHSPTGHKVNVREDGK